MPARYQTFPPTPAEYFALFETTGWKDEYRLTPHDLARALKQSAFMVSAYDEGRLIGFGRVVSDSCRASSSRIDTRTESDKHSTAFPRTRPWRT